MQALKARVKNGKIVVHEPTDLPDGTVLDLVVVGMGDDLDEDERAALQAAINEGFADMRSRDGAGAAEDTVEPKPEVFCR